MTGILNTEDAPGAFARVHLAELARAHGGYPALAKLVGLSRAWATLAPRGLVPRPSTFVRIGRACELPPDLTQRLVTDATAFRQNAAAAQRHRVTCRECGKEVKRGSGAATRSYEPNGRSFVCRPCATQREIVCPDCGEKRTIPKWELENRKRLAAQRGVVYRRGKDGILFIRCARCASVHNLATARESGATRIIEHRIGTIQRQGPKKDGDHQLLATLVAHELTVTTSWRLLDHDHVRKADVQGLLKTLRAEEFLDNPRGFQRKRGTHLSDAELVVRRGPRPARARAVVIGAHLTGTLTLCPLCGLLVYRPTRRRERVWHGPCWASWLRSKIVRGWLSERRAFLRNGVAKDILPEFPLPEPQPDGVARVEESDLLAGYRTLIQFMAGRSRAMLATDEEVSETAITHRIKSIAKRLPASWSLVFMRAATGKGNAVRQQLCPLPRLQPEAITARQAAAQRMSNFGVPGDVITQVTGFPSEAPVTSGGGASTSGNSSRKRAHS